MTAIEKVTSAIAAVFMFAIMIIVFRDVVMRYVFNRPFSWAYDLISLYILAGVFFLSLSGTYAVNGHINVDILLPRFSDRSSGCCDHHLEPRRAFRSSPRSPGSAISARSTTSCPADVMAGAIPWPTWAVGRPSCRSAPASWRCGWRCI